MAIAAPTSADLIDEKTARMNAFVCVAAMMAFLLTSQILLIFLITLDFYLRVFVSPKASPILILNAALLNYLDIEPSMVKADPAILSAKIGFFVSVIILLLVLLNLGLLPLVLALLLEAIMALEAYGGVYVGSRLHPLVNRTRASLSQLSSR